MTDLRTAVKRKESEMRFAKREREIRSVIRQVARAESVDLAFVIDATGSMASYIEGVKRHIRTIIKEVKRTHPGLSLRMAVVAYRDVDDANRFEVLDFVSSVEEFESFVATIAAKGGGDLPEDMAGGLQQANHLHWKNTTRVVFCIADAPCHGREYCDKRDKYPGGTPGICIASELASLFNRRSSNAGTMTVHFCAAGEAGPNLTKKMVLRLNEQMGARSDLGPEDQLVSVSLQDAKMLTDIVSKGVRTSILKTTTALRDCKDGSSCSRPAKRSRLDF